MHNVSWGFYQRSRGRGLCAPPCERRRCCVAGYIRHLLLSGPPLTALHRPSAACGEGVVCVCGSVVVVAAYSRDQGLTLSIIASCTHPSTSFAPAKIAYSWVLVPRPIPAHT